MLKIKVNFDERSYQTLLNDMVMFGVVKGDGTPNKNKFMNILFENYYENYLKDIETIKKYASKVLKSHGISNNEAASDIALDLFDYKHQSVDTYYSESLTFYLSDKNEFLFEAVNESLSKLGASAFFRKMVYKYLEIPQYKREQIIYKDAVEEINHAIENNRSIKLKLNKEDVIIRPYKIGTNKEEIYSYLLGYVKDKPASIHIRKIGALILIKDPINFTDEEISLLSQIDKLGIQFPFRHICKAEIVLSNQGVATFKKKYLNRPIPVKVEGNHYFFECSFDQLVVYFSSFGSQMNVVSPDYLANVFYKSYKGYVDAYGHNLNNGK